MAPPATEVPRRPYYVQSENALVERRSRYVCLVRLAGKETQTVVQALT